MCDTGIALLAYMDGITDSPTLGGVVLAVTAACSFAVFKVRLLRVGIKIDPFLSGIRFISMKLFILFFRSKSV